MTSGRCALRLRTWVQRGRQTLDADEALWLALERIVEVVGEAASHLSETTKAQYPEVGWGDVVGSRIIYTHQYHRIDRDLLWNTAARSLPALFRELGPLA